MHHLKTRRAAPALILTVVFLTSASAAEAKRFMTPGFRTMDSRPETLAVLPPHADLIKKKLLVSHELVEEAALLERAASSWIAGLLEEKGYRVEIVTSSQLHSNLELGEAVRRVNRRYDEEWRQLIRRPKKVRSGRYGVGEDARRAAALLGVDGLVIPRIQAVGVTKGRQALALFAGGTRSYARLDLAVVGGETGGVEAFFAGIIRASLKKLTLKADKLMMKASKSALNKYPQSSQALKPKGQVAAEAAEDDEETEAAVLGDLEALLAPKDSRQEP